MRSIIAQVFVAFIAIAAASQADAAVGFQHFSISDPQAATHRGRRLVSHRRCAEAAGD